MQWQRRWTFALTLVVVAGAVGGHEARCETPEVVQVNWDAEKLGPKSSASVVWVGHSLIEHKVESSWGQVDLMSMVGKLAQSRDLNYAMRDHTLFGAPLSALWRGRPHGFIRDASEMVGKREALERDAARYDTIVLTEATPVSKTAEVEFSPYYLRRFYCTVLNANPNARAYLYESWISYQNNPDADAKVLASDFDWRAEMKKERAAWDALADAARKSEVAAPHWLSRFGWTSTSDGGCASVDPIYTVPVGSAWLALDQRLSSPQPGDHFTWPDGRPFQMEDLVENPLVETSNGTMSPRDPKKPLDDIHASLAGIYLAGLVNFATLYRQTPVGLPVPSELGDGLGRTLQCVAWETVVNDPRSGVEGEADC